MGALKESTSTVYRFFTLAALLSYVGAAPLFLKLCNVANIEVVRADGSLVPLPALATALAVAVAAVEHVNTRNFTLVSDGADLLGNRAVHVELLSVNLPSATDAYLAPMAVKTCSELGAHYILGLPSATFAEAGSLMTQYYGTPLSSVMVVSSRLSDENTFPLFHRLVPTTVDRLPAVIRFIRKMGWRQVAIAYSADVGGEATRSAIQKEFDAEGIQFAAFAFPDAKDPQSYITQFAAIKSSGIKVVLNYLRLDHHSTLFNAIHDTDEQEFVSALTWIQPSAPLDILAGMGYPMYKVLFPHLETGIDGMLAFQREYDYTALQEAYMNADLFSTFNGTVQPDGLPAALLPVTYHFARQPMESEALVRMYDSVWAAVGALVRAEKTLMASGVSAGLRTVGSAGDEDRKALSLQAHSEIKSGTFSFSGLSGRVSFRSNGDFGTDPNADLAVVNYVLPSSNSTFEISADGALLQTRTCGYFRDDEWVLYTNDTDGTHWPIHWPDGGVYPQVRAGGCISNPKPYYNACHLYCSIRECPYTGSSHVLLHVLFAHNALLVMQTYLSIVYVIGSGYVSICPKWQFSSSLNLASIRQIDYRYIVGCIMSCAYL